MFTSLTSAVVRANGDVALDASLEEIDAATSFHVLGFSSYGDLLIAESEGSFNIATWEQVTGIAGAACWGDMTRDERFEGSGFSKHELNGEGNLRTAIAQWYSKGIDGGGSAC